MLISHTVSGTTTEICVSRVAEINCPADQVIQVASARYGRMQLGSCITFDVGMGCFSDILQTADRWCSGQRTCTIGNYKNEMDRQLGIPCPEELTSYIEIRHDCTEGNFCFIKYGNNLLYRMRG